MLSGGHSVVSCVANPVVVEMDATWKEASFSAVVKEEYPPLIIKSAVTMTMAIPTRKRNTLTVSDFQKYRGFPLKNARNRIPKWMPAASIVMVSTISAAGLA